MLLKLVLAFEDFNADLAVVQAPVDPQVVQVLWGCRQRVFAVIFCFVLAVGHFVMAVYQMSFENFRVKEHLLSTNEASVSYFV